VRVVVVCLGDAVGGREECLLISVANKIILADRLQVPLNDDQATKSSTGTKLVSQKAVMYTSVDGRKNRLDRNSTCEY
jgi:hypothetical protein